MEATGRRMRPEVLHERREITCDIEVTQDPHFLLRQGLHSASKREYRVPYCTVLVHLLESRDCRKFKSVFEMPSFGAACQLWIKKGIVGECQLTNAESRNQIRYDTSAEGLYGVSCRGCLGSRRSKNGHCWESLDSDNFRTLTRGMPKEMKAAMLKDSIQDFKRVLSCFCRSGRRNYQNRVWVGSNSRNVGFALV